MTYVEHFSLVGHSFELKIPTYFLDGREHFQSNLERDCQGLVHRKTIVRKFYKPEPQQESSQVRCSHRECHRPASRVSLDRALSCPQALAARESLRPRQKLYFSIAMYHKPSFTANCKPTCKRVVMPKNLWQCGLDRFTSQFITFWFNLK